MPFIEDLSAFFNANEFATTVIYNSISGSVLTVDIIVVLGVIRVGFDSEMSVSHDEITFKNPDIPNPRRNDTFVAVDATYTLISEIANDGVTSIWLVKNG